MAQKVLAGTDSNVAALQRMKRMAVNANSRGINRIGGGVSSSESAVAGRIDSGNSTDGFNVTIFANGVDEDSTGTATGVRALDIATNDRAAIGEYVQLIPSTIKITAWEEVE